MTLVLGMAGGSGSGKSWLAAGLAEALGPLCLHLAHDAYYHPLPPHMKARPQDWNFDAPEALDNVLLAAHLDALKAGRPVDVPEYAFDLHERVGHATVTPRPILLVEGILLLSEPTLVAQLDLAVFVDTPEELRIERRLYRDVRERGRTPEDVRTQLDRWVRPMHERHVEPARARAHLVLDGRRPRDENVRAVLARLPDELR